MFKTQTDGQINYHNSKLKRLFHLDLCNHSDTHTSSISDKPPDESVKLILFCLKQSIGYVYSQAF